MLKKLLIIIVALGMPFTAYAADVDFVLDVRPLAVLFSSDVDGFYLSRSETGSYYSYQEQIEIDGTGSYVPNLNIGVGIDTPVARFDMTAGLCYLWNNAFSGGLYTVQAAAGFKLGRAVTLGPRIGLVFSDNLNFNDVGDDEVWLSADSGTQGLLYGLDFTAGGKRVGFHLSLDYYALDPYEVHISPTSDLQASASELDLSGTAINMGIIFHF